MVGFFLEFPFISVSKCASKIVNFQNRISPPIVHTKVNQRYSNDAGDFLCKMMLILEV